MAYTVEQFIKIDLTVGQVRCAGCGTDLHENIHSAGGPSCSDCYFDELSKLVESHPVGVPMSRYPKHGL